MLIIAHNTYRSSIVSVQLVQTTNECLAFSRAVEPYRSCRSDVLVCTQATDERSIDTYIHDIGRCGYFHRGGVR